MNPTHMGYLLGVLGFTNNDNKVKICKILYISQICAWELFIVILEVDGNSIHH
jgi:hypothetical protein